MIGSEPRKDWIKNQARELGPQFFGHSVTPTAKSDHGGRLSWLSKEGMLIIIGPDTDAEQWGDKTHHIMKKLE